MRSLLALILLPLLWGAVPAFAANSAWEGDEDVKVRLVSAVDGTSQADPLWLGLEVQLADGWHTYWRSPGEAGLPPQIDWSNSTSESGNIADTTLLYPAPQRHNLYGMEAVGYSNHVLFPIEAQLQEKGRIAEIDIALDLLICKSLCVPKHFALLLTIPAGESRRSAEAPLIEEARAQIPPPPEKAKIHVTKIERHAKELEITLKSDTAFGKLDLFVESEFHIAFGAPVIKEGATETQLTARLPLAQALPADVTLQNLDFTLTAVDSTKSLEQTFTAAAPQVPESEHVPFDFVELIVMIFTALLGGFILNLMPCVLPVLSLKISHAMGHGGGDEDHVRRNFLITAAGILFSFLVLATGTILLREAGHVVGWGIQFQQPAFLIFLIVLLSLFAANLMGFFDIRLPRIVADHLASHTSSQSLGAFISGAFATLLATPCTAPFLGTAVGFALASEAPVIIVIFLSLGLGLSLPYLVIAAWPRLATALPKPGQWMVKLRQFLGLALLATALWLGWILTTQLTPQHTDAAAQSRASIDAGWQKFDESDIATMVGYGKVVFVDITADWCLTCKANKKFTLDNDAVAEKLFHDPAVVAMQGDWTNPDPVLAAYLKKFNRYGIPFNIIYGPGAPNGILLPEILTPSIFLEALNIAKQQPL